MKKVGGFFFIIMLSSWAIASDDAVAFNLKIFRAKNLLQTNPAGKAMVEEMEKTSIDIQQDSADLSSESGGIKFNQSGPTILVSADLSDLDFARVLAHQFIHYKDALESQRMWSDARVRPTYAEESYMYAIQAHSCLKSKPRGECEKSFGVDLVRANILIAFASEYHAFAQADLMLSTIAPQYFGWRLPRESHIVLAREDDMVNYININYLRDSFLTPISPAELLSLKEETRKLGSLTAIYQKYFPEIFN